ncbi:hypothetical protein OEZ85_013642 [Tetradesmus obliquus]|uniref:Protein kinase domain-containing protein n=1 Tax=Tetradesmus obliquus TaxID=3088 RepID=A0ABY8UQZ2_TETOB|nr:hypothetical protein OEZ85_013642 [Tetradesmus obliquus]
MLSKHGVGRSAVLLITALACILYSSTAAAQLQPGPSSSKNSPRRALLQAPAAAAGGAAAKPQFENGFAAMLGLPEGKVIRDTYLNTFGTMSDPSMRLKFQGLLTLASDRNAKATFFWPLDGGFASISKQLCMSVQQIQDTLASAPDVALQYMNINILNGTTLMSSDFKDGANLQTMEPGFTLPLRKRVVNGATQWYFPKAAYNQDDVTLQRLDVTAGSAVIHFVDYLIFSPAQRTFWAQQAKNMKCGEGGGPVAAAKGADQLPPPQQSQGVNAGMIAGIAIAGAVAIAALVVLLVLLRRRPLAKRLSGAFGVASPQQQQKPGDAATRGMMPPVTPPYGGGAGSGSGDAGWQGLGSDFLDEAAAMRTPDITQETAPVAIKDPHHHAGAAAAMLGTPPLAYNSLTAPATPQSSTALARSSSSGKGLAAAVAAAAAGGGAAAAAAKGGVEGGKGAHGGSETSSSGSSGAKEAAFAEQLRRELHPQHGNPNIIGNYTNFTREVEHSNTAVYFCDGMHNNRQFALKFYASHEDFMAEMMAYKELGGPSSKFVPVLEMSYPGSSSYPTSVLVFERGQCTLETFARQRPSYFQQIDIFHQLVSAVQHLHEHGTVHRDLKPSNVVHFPEKFAWKLIDLATVARIGQKTKVVYTREYVSPEVAQAVVGGAVSIVAEPSWDLWGIGIIMWELATGQRYFPPEWSMDGGRRMWSALCGFEPLPHELIDISTMRGVDRGVMKLPLPHELIDISTMRGVDRGVMKLVRRLLQRDPALRPTPRQLLSERLFQARGVTTTQVSQGSNISHGSAGSGHLIIQE